MKPKTFKPLAAFAIVLGMLLCGAFATNYTEVFSIAAIAPYGQGCTAANSFTQTFISTANTSVARVSFIEGNTAGAPGGTMTAYLSYANNTVIGTSNPVAYTDALVEKNFTFNNTVLDTSSSYKLYIDASDGGNVKCIVIATDADYYLDGSADRGENGWPPIYDMNLRFYSANPENETNETELVVFPGGELNITVNGKTDLTLVGEGAFPADDYYLDNQFNVKVTNGSLTYALSVGQIKNSTNLSAPTIIVNDTNLVDNTTVQNNMGFNCASAGHYCAANLSEITNFSLNYPSGDSIVIAGNLMIRNLSNTKGAVNTWYALATDGNAPVDFDEAFTSSFDIPVFRPLTFYKNTANGQAAVIAGFLPDTPAYLLNASTDPFVRLRVNRNSDGVRVMQVNTGGSAGKALVLNNSTTPLLFFEYPLTNVSNPAELYTVSAAISTNAVAPYPLGGNIPLGFEVSMGVGQRGNVQGDTGLGSDAFNVTEYVETSCDLSAFYPLTNGSCVLYGTYVPPVTPGYHPTYTTGDFVKITFDTLGGIGVAVKTLAVLVALGVGYMFATGKLGTGMKK